MQLLMAFFRRSVLELLISLLSTGVVAALIAAFVSMRTNATNVQIENVTQERAKWREAMRRLADDLIRAAHASDTDAAGLLCAQLALNVNPLHAEDMALVQAAERLCETDTPDAQVREFTERMALLLKHDWERAKHEAQPWGAYRNQPRRIPYDEFKSLPSSSVNQ